MLFIVRRFLKLFAVCLKLFAAAPLVGRNAGVRGIMLGNTRRYTKNSPYAVELF